MADPLPVRIVMATDITAQSDLTVAYQKLAMTDRLTGLANRRHAEQAIRRESARARRSGGALSLALVDVDFFKRINDSLGHAAGDQVLVSISKVLTASMRDSDFASRWGGEEFLLVMADTELGGGLVCCERIRQNIENGVEAGRPAGHGLDRPGAVSPGRALREDDRPRRRETVRSEAGRPEPGLCRASRVGAPGSML